ncbi:MAG: PIG-L family deacetylase [Nanoarchaeota archaeon]|nr:PIG-L family deacetylase [Nanoarchaeota archaeon]
MTEKVLVFCAHPDDQVIGAGGTLIKYAREGKDIMIVIMSKGEGSHPWLKEEIITEMRQKEIERADKIIGTNTTISLGLKDASFFKDAKETNVSEQIANIIKEFQPNKILTHTAVDPHPDHKTTNKLVTAAFDSLNSEADLYTFDVWNPLNAKGTNHPKLVVDISKTFKKKIHAFKTFKSQKAAIFSLLMPVYFRAIYNGLKNHCKYAEVFYKIR